MKQRNVIVLMLALALLAGCGKKGPTQPERIKAFNKSGWSAVENGNFAAALQEFLDALVLDDTNLEARLGAGWSIILLDDIDLQIAVDYLDSTVTASTQWQLDAWAGLATVALTDRRYAAADSFATLTLAGDSSYVFVYMETINWRDIQLIQGQARFGLSQYASSWLAIEPLTVDTPYANVLITDATTWVSGLITYSYFEEILAIVITHLSELFRGT